MKISSNLSGDLIELPVKVGDKVKKGQVLGRIDRRRFEAAAKQAQAAVSGARADIANAQVDVDRTKLELDRVQGLVEQGHGLRRRGGQGQVGPRRRPWPA